jgi:Tfp pilus assembly PilM family ATPase
MEEFIDEIHKIMGYVRSDVADSIFGGIYIYGQGSMVLNIDNYLERRLNIPVKLVNPMTKEFLQLDGFPAGIFDDTTYTLALGLALRKVTWL